jgi:hypothetical protein
MRRSIEMSEAEINREVQRITMKFAKGMVGYDHGMMGAVLGNLLGMYLWTFPADTREDMAAAVVVLAMKLLQGMPPQPPQDFRAPS